MTRFTKARTLAAAALLVVGSLMLMPSAARADAMVTDVSANPPGTQGSFDSNPGTDDATDAAGPFSGNDNGYDPADDFGDFGGGTWSLVGKSDDANNGPFTGNPNTVSSGTLFFDTPQSGPFVITLKAGDFFSAYLFDDSFVDVESIDFTTANTAVNENDIPLNLSHSSLFILQDGDEDDGGGGQDDGDDDDGDDDDGDDDDGGGGSPGAGEIPEPGTLILWGVLGLGATGLGFGRRWGKKKTA